MLSDVPSEVLSGNKESNVLPNIKRAKNQGSSQFEEQSRKQNNILVDQVPTLGEIEQEKSEDATN